MKINNPPISYESWDEFYDKTKCSCARECTSLLDIKDNEKLPRWLNWVFKKDCPKCKGEGWVKEKKPTSIKSIVESLIYNARRQGIYINELFLEQEEYEQFIREPLVAEIIKTSRYFELLREKYGTDPRKHIFWDGLHIINNALPLEEKEHLIDFNRSREQSQEDETKTVGKQLIGYKRSKTMIFNIENLIDIKCNAKIEAGVTRNPAWKRAYLRLADAADHLSLIMFRCEENCVEKERLTE